MPPREPRGSAVARDAARLARLARNAVRSRAAARAVERLLAERAPAPEGRYEVAVHFPDFPVNLYQIRQWYAPLVELDQHHRVVVVARYATTARQLLEECPLPVVLARSIAQVEVLLSTHPVRAVLYVNQNVRNFSALRHREPAHVFICHGESDKDYMSSNQMKAYDVALVAGAAAAARLERLIGYDVPSRTIQVGRPQVDVVHVPPIEMAPPDGRTVVLYAPTWEGDRPSMSYSSVTSHARDMVAALLADPRYRVVVRAHPRTGSSDPAAGAALRALRSMVDAANRADPTARHLWDHGATFGWQLGACDMCVTDVSAVAYDWLATGKPLVVTAPFAPDAVVDRSGLMGALPLLAAEEAGDVIARLEAARGAEEAARLRTLAEHYYGDLTPGSATARFLAAMDRILTERSEALAARRSEAEGEGDPRTARNTEQAASPPVGPQVLPGTPEVLGEVDLHRPEVGDVDR